jgi:hypothetical protein
MRKNGRKRPIRVLEMRARRRDPAGVSHRLLVRYHDGIMTACRLQCIDLEGEELGELLATEQWAPMAAMTRWGLFKSPGPREPLGLLPACGPGTCPPTGVLGCTGAARGARAWGGGAAAGQRAVCPAVNPSPVKQVLSPRNPQDST